MPHKRAKHTAREQNRSKSGSDLPPGAKHSINNEAIPKSIARVLNATKVQKEWAEKNRKRKIGEEEDVREGTARKKRKNGAEHEEQDRKMDIRIQPGESIAQFNRRVEDSMRPAMRDAAKASSARVKKLRKEEQVAKAEKSSSTPSETKSHPKKEQDDGKESTTVPSGKEKQTAERDQRPKDFQSLSSSAPRRLNDIVQAPPDIKKLPRGAEKVAAAKEAGRKAAEGKTLRQGVLSMAQKAMLEEERERAVRMYRELKKRKAAG
ncbi:hypothetical protein SCP_0509770 [Sparassis crispa]|uniref:Uncharacterized protein n=1 Tax=Sparassis crispa TaxID=139825 RepID=A0A401GNX0_9APHY|nr:hypothetical protein SCP_0509770 [Sparassis crispa]GBE83918.1 hypothetical protein SCP_0509770 [Sparassis crispa]